MYYRVLFRDGTALSLDAADEFAAVDKVRGQDAGRIMDRRPHANPGRQIWRVEDETGRVVLGEGYENPPEEPRNE